MKIMGMVDSGTYLCQVSHQELCKVMNKSSYGDGQLKPLKVGDELDLGQGHNFRNEIKVACEKLVEAHRASHRAHESLINFAELIVAQPQEQENAEN